MTVSTLLTLLIILLRRIVESGLFFALVMVPDGNVVQWRAPSYVTVSRAWPARVSPLSTVSTWPCMAFLSRHSSVVTLWPLSFLVMSVVTLCLCLPSSRLTLLDA